MGFGYFARGWNEQADRETNKRLKMIQFVNQYRQQNPYATAEELTGVIENLTGGANHWLRGALPSAQQIQQMGAEGEKRKKYDDLAQKTRAVQGQAQTADAVRSVFERISVDEADPYAALNKTFETLGVQDEEEKAQVSSMIGNPVAVRQNMIRRRERERRSEIYGDLEQMKRVGAFSDSRALKQLYPDMPQEALDNVVQGWKADEEIKEHRLAQARQTRITEIASDPGLITQMQTGAFRGNSDLLEEHINARLGAFDMEPEERAQTVKDIIGKLRANVDMANIKTREAKMERITPVLEAEYEQLEEMNSKKLKPAVAMYGDEIKAAVNFIAGGELFDERQLNELNAILPEIDDKYSGEPIAKIVEAIKRRVGPLTPKRNSKMYALDRARQMLPQPMSEPDFDKQAMANVEKISGEFDRELTGVRRAMMDARSSSESHQSSALAEAQALFKWTRQQLQAQLEGIQASRDTPEEQLGGGWSPNAGAQAEAAIKAEMSRIDQMANELMQGPEFETAPQQSPSPAVEPEREPIPMGMGSKRPRAPKYNIGLPKEEQGGPVDIKNMKGRVPLDALPNTSAARQISNAIEVAASEHQLPPDVKALMYALVETESNFRLNAKNKRTGALGPFQFIEGTARQYGLSDPTDPYASADATARMLKDSYRRQGNWFDAAVAHHSGSAWKNLGPNGMDYAKKLYDRYQKYLNA